MTMFRPKKKRSKPSFLRSKEAESDEEDEKISVVKRATSKKRKVPIRSFEIGSEPAVVFAVSQKSSGIGFGGAVSTTEETDHTANVYSSDALSRLKAEQSVKPAPSDQGQSPPPPNSDTPSVPSTATANNNDEMASDFIAFDETMQHSQTVEMTEHGLDLGHGDDEAREASMLEQTIDDSDWEAQIAKRAGLSSSYSPNTTSQQYQPSMENGPSAGRGSPNANSPGKDLAAMSQLRTQITDTIASIESQRSDMESRLRRREADVDNNKKSISRYEKDLSEAGNALEFYQKWRTKFCEFIGALRELRLKVEPILIAMHELEGEKAAVYRWEEWEDDNIAGVQGKLEKILGRQPDPRVQIAEKTVDEFGRDVKSKHELQIEKRLSHRKRICQQRRSRASSIDLSAENIDLAEKFVIRGDESDAFVSDGEEETFRERHSALKKALAVALDDIDEEYTSLQNLFDFFETWKNLFHTEYQQCFASLSLADIAGVLVQAELCSLNDPWNQSAGYNEAKWTAVVHEALTNGTFDPAAAERLLEKCVFPTVYDLLKKKGINLLSSKQTKSFGEFTLHMQRLVPADSQVWIKFRDRLTKHISEQFCRMAVPIVTKSVSWDNLQESERDALNAATWGQLYRIKKTLLNILTHIVPVLANDALFIDILLNYISNEFLCLLSSLQTSESGAGIVQSPAEVFQSVYQCLEQTEWLDFPEYMLLAAPIRAAAAVYIATDS